MFYVSAESAIDYAMSRQLVVVIRDTDNKSFGICAHWWDLPLHFLFVALLVCGLIKWF